MPKRKNNIGLNNNKAQHTIMPMAEKRGGTKMMPDDPMAVLIEEFQDFLQRRGRDECYPLPWDDVELLLQHIAGLNSEIQRLRGIEEHVKNSPQDELCLSPWGFYQQR